MKKFVLLGMAWLGSVAGAAPSDWQETFNNYIKQGDGTAALIKLPYGRTAYLTDQVLGVYSYLRFPNSRDVIFTCTQFYNSGRQGDNLVLEKVDFTNRYNTLEHPDIAQGMQSSDRGEVETTLEIACGGPDEGSSVSRTTVYVPSGETFKLGGGFEDFRVKLSRGEFLSIGASVTR